MLVAVAREQGMKYLFLAYEDVNQWANVPEGERELIEEACTAQEQELRQSGYLVAFEDFQSNQTVVTVQIANGKLSLSDSTLAETKKRLIQLFIINARDLNEAIQLVSRMPQTQKGVIEVRPLLEPDQQPFQA